MRCQCNEKCATRAAILKGPNYDILQIQGTEAFRWPPEHRNEEIEHEDVCKEDVDREKRAWNKCCILRTSWQDAVRSRSCLACQRSCQTHAQNRSAVIAIQVDITFQDIKRFLWTETVLLWLINSMQITYEKYHFPPNHYSLVFQPTIFANLFGQIFVQVKILWMNESSFIHQLTIGCTHGTLSCIITGHYSSQQTRHNIPEK